MTKQSFIVFSLILLTLIALPFASAKANDRDANDPPIIACSASPSQVSTGATVAFSSDVTWSYGNAPRYSWTGDCTGTSANCVISFSTPGTKTAALRVTAANNLSSTTSCSAVVTAPVQPTPPTPTCAPNFQQRCVGNNLYWYDSCGVQAAFIVYCPNGCNGNSCAQQPITPACTSNYQQRCVGNQMFWYDSCGNQQNYVGMCGQNYNYNNYNYNYVPNYNTCTSNYQQRCVGNQMFWYDSCGNQQNYVGMCGQNYNYNYNYNSYGNCTYHAYKNCAGNNVYWFDSCGTQQDFYYSCGSQACQNGQCSAYVQPPVVYYQPQSNYAAHSTKACYSNSVYWYDSLGVRSGLYKSCVDSNSCTQDACANGKCSNTLKCDGSTCATGSTDYNKYCQATPVANQNHCGNGLCETTLGETSANCPSDCKTSVSALSVSFFAKQDANLTQWQKTAQVGSNGQMYFMISIANNSATQVDSVYVSANIPSEVASLGNLQVNGVSVSGDIVAGINIGSLAPSTAKSITFEGKTQSISAASTKQAYATGNTPGAMQQSDAVSINFNPTQTPAAVSAAPATSGFIGFLKRWYVWILVGLVLIFLFVIVFRRLSSNE